MIFIRTQKNRLNLQSDTVTSQVNRYQKYILPL